VDTYSAELAIKALDCLSLRAEAVASNIANANTVAYRPLKIDFEEALRDAAGRGSAAIRAFEPKISRSVDALTGPGVRLDGQLATASATGARYMALIEILGRRLQIESVALSGTGA
jgi:flagellar basal-body rod protein FlgB